MDLNTITEIARPASRAELPKWRAGDAWLAGGTWLYSEPQPRLTRLIDLTQLNWPALRPTDEGLEIAATCSVAELHAAASTLAPQWRAAPLIEQCCHAFLASFKIWKTATVGGNLCLALPAGAMISLTAALDGVCTIWSPDGGERKVAVLDFIRGPQQPALAQGDLLRAITLPPAALAAGTAFRQISLTPVGRSAAVVIGKTAAGGGLDLTVTASTRRPLRLSFAAMPDAAGLRQQILSDIADALYHDDHHGAPAWRKAMTLRLAEEVRRELAGEAP